MLVHAPLSFEAAAALILLMGVLAQWLAWRTRIPSIILLSLCGFIAGPVLGLLKPEQQFGHAFQAIIGLSVAVILFDGGLNLRFHELKQAVSGVRRLVYLGVPLGFGIYSVATHYIGGLSWPVALVFGAIIVVTGPTVIMPLLRQAMLKSRIASFLKWEAILNDPIGALLAVLVFDYFVYSTRGEFSGGVLWELAAAVGVAALLGGGAAYLMGLALRHNALPEYLKHPLTLAVVVAVFVGANILQDGAGLLAVTAMGVVMGNMRLADIEELRRFKEYISILLLAVVFILLTASLEPHVLMRLRWGGALLILVIMLLARPLAIWIATLGARMPRREKWLLAWIAPRGIVAAATAGVFAPRLEAAGYADANLLVPLVFALIFVSVLVHGLTLGRLARALGLAANSRNRLLIVGASPWTVELARALQEGGGGVLLVDDSWHRLRAARLAGVPVYYGEILSDTAEAALDLHDVGALLAASGNDAYNALVCTTFGPQLGRGHVFQLPMAAADAGDPKAMTRSVRGRIAFTDTAFYDDLWTRLAQGWVFQKTHLTQTYGYPQYLQDLPPGSLPLLALGEQGVQMNGPRTSFNPGAGDTVFSFGMPRREPSSGTLLTADSTGSA